MSVTAADVAAFLGKSGNAATEAMAAQHLSVVTAMAHGYTRGAGFDETGAPFEDVGAVILTATARLMANPTQLAQSAGPFVLNGGFSGWSLAEIFVLNRHRKKAL